MQQPEHTFYNKGIPTEELNRLRRLAFPHFVSVSLLSKCELHAVKVADIGCGPNPQLGILISQLGGVYFPVDFNTEMLKQIETALKESGHEASGSQASVDALPFATQSIDIAHARFLLEHLSPEKRVLAVKEMFRVSKETFLLQYQWSALKSSNNQERLNDFSQTIGEFAALVGIDLSVGENLVALVQEAAPTASIAIEVFDREEGIYTDELVGLCTASAARAESISLQTKQGINSEIAADEILKIEQTAAAFAHLAERLKSLADNFGENPIEFIPPSIISVHIK